MARSTRRTKAVADGGARLGDLAELRGAGYGILSLLLSYPDDEQALRRAALAAELERGTGVLGGFAFFPRVRSLLERLSALDEEGAAQLEAEYLDLFVLGGAQAPCPLYESAYVDRRGRDRGLAMVAVERAYAQAGIALGPAAGGELPDHASLELEFLSQLCAREAEAWRARAAEEAVARLESERRFLDRHLLRWFPSLVRRVAASAEGSFYVDVAEAAHAFLIHERDLIGLLLEAQRAPAATAE